ncbi:MAG: hypothetical protein BM564_03455 [Bacteroidetes bacterium MedPE-SWsnd-G2]|nr:MAG: hypothetical protein BM564_03455 [Bacteroidetes bacterium MedPE-SWsnd-G2]
MPRTIYPNITSIRFFLAVLVVIFHVSQFSENQGLPYFNDWAVFQKGTEAVYMFFSLSGFLIIKQLYDEKKFTNSINLKAFYTRRALRIFPLYYLILIFGFLYYQVILPQLGYPVENNYDLLSGILLASTFFSNVFSTFQPGGILEILWSIGVEEQFYLFIAPTLLLLPIKRIKIYLVGFTLVYFSLFFSEAFSFLRTYNMLFFYFSFSGICALFMHKFKLNKSHYSLLIPISVLTIFYFNSNYFKHELGAISYHAISMILFGVFITLLSLKPLKLLEHRSLKYLGKISYGIYMFHPIIMQLVGFLFLKYQLDASENNLVSVVFINVSIIALTIITSHLSYKYFESYFLSLKSKSRILYQKK